MTQELLYFNGVNASSGDYLLPPLDAQELARVARGESFTPEHLLELKWRQAQKQSHYGVKEGVDPKDLAQAGWGVIFAADAEPVVRDALRELLDLRKAQANGIQERYREYIGEKGYRPNESKNMFLARQGAGPGTVDPDKVPYYLLLVGGPEKIPYAFQYQLDVAYAVGRIHFDTPDDYARYARSVVRAEQENLALGARAVFFGTANPDDPNTQLSAERLVKPLAEKLRTERTTWRLDEYLAADATKARLEALLGKEETPALLFTASHGIGFDLGDPRQLKHQGALLTQDWTGPVATRGAGIPQTMYYAADDLSNDARVFGMVALHFACFGAGTPRFDEFAHLREGVREPVQIAPTSFVANLPKKLLAHPKGGALAVIGHVDRAWGSSFFWDKSIEQLSTFESVLNRLLDGHPVGSATEYFNERYAELASSLSATLEDQRRGRQTDAKELATLWTANNDARGYAVIGDPAVRLRAGGPILAARSTRASITLRAEAGTEDAANPQLDAALEKLEQQVAALGETLKELREAARAKHS